jgi:uncharacterized MAPEG superfamily protein
MEREVLILTLGAILLLVHVFVAGHFKTRQYGAKWNVGARDESLPPLTPVAGRLVRAQANFLETFPVAVVALLGVVVTNRASPLTELGGWIWLGSRVAYLPLYGFGVRGVRTAVFLLSIVGLGMTICPLLTLA